MLGSVHESKPSDEGDIDPRALGAVVLISGLMALAIGAGMLLTGSGERGTAESIPGTPAPRRTQSTLVRPTGAVAPPVESRLPAAPANLPPAGQVYQDGSYFQSEPIEAAPVLPPGPPHPVQPPILLPLP